MSKNVPDFTSVPPCAPRALVTTVGASLHRMSIGSRAEMTGFEPAQPYGLPVFEAGAVPVTLYISKCWVRGELSPLSAVCCCSLLFELVPPDAVNKRVPGPIFSSGGSFILIDQ